MRCPPPHQNTRASSSASSVTTSHNTTNTCTPYYVHSLRNRISFLSSALHSSSSFAKRRQEAPTHRGRRCNTYINSINKSSIHHTKHSVNFKPTHHKPYGRGGIKQHESILSACTPSTSNGRMVPSATSNSTTQFNTIQNITTTSTGYKNIPPTPSSITTISSIPSTTSNITSTAEQPLQSKQFTKQYTTLTTIPPTTPHTIFTPFNITSPTSTPSAPSTPSKTISNTHQVSGSPRIHQLASKITTLQVAVSRKKKRHLHHNRRILETMSRINECDTQHVNHTDVTPPSHSVMYLPQNLSVQRIAKEIAQKQHRHQTLKFCKFFNMHGYCYKADSCGYHHDPEMLRVCPLYLEGLCCDANCPLSHTCVSPVPICGKFLKGLCTKGGNCEYRHIMFENVMQSIEKDVIKLNGITESIANHPTTTTVNTVKVGEDMVVERYYRHASSHEASQPSTNNEAVNDTNVLCGDFIPFDTEDCD